MKEKEFNVFGNRDKKRERKKHVDYFLLVHIILTQVLTRHVCFKKYLKRFKRITVASYLYFWNAKNNVGHTVFDCTRWRDVRRKANELMIEKKQIFR